MTDTDTQTQPKLQIPQVQPTEIELLQQQVNELKANRDMMLALYSVVMKLLDSHELPEPVEQEIVRLLELSPDLVQEQMRNAYIKEGIKLAIALAEKKVEQARAYEAECTEATLMSFIQALKEIGLDRKQRPVN